MKRDIREEETHSYVNQCVSCFQPRWNNRELDLYSLLKLLKKQINIWYNGCQDIGYLATKDSDSSDGKQLN